MEQEITRKALVREMMEKMELISQRLEERRGRRAAHLFDHAYMSYLLNNEEHEFCADELISDVWPKAKKIIDRERALEAQLPKADPVKRFADFKALIAKTRRWQEEQLSNLADDIEIHVDDLRWYMFFFDDILSDDGYEEAGGDAEWGNYADFTELVITGDESEAVKYLHGIIRTCFESAKRKGNYFTFDEMATNYFRLEEYQAKRDWDSWRAMLDIMYGNHQSEGDASQVDESSEGNTATNTRPAQQQESKGKNRAG